MQYLKASIAPESVAHLPRAVRCHSESYRLEKKRHELRVMFWRGRRVAGSDPLEESVEVGEEVRTLVDRVPMDLQLHGSEQRC